MLAKLKKQLESREHVILYFRSIDHDHEKLCAEIADIRREM